MGLGAVLLCVACFAIGCQSPLSDRAISDSVAAQNAAADNGVQQASWETPSTAPGVSLPAPGTSLAELDDPADRELTEKIGSALSPKENYKRAKKLVGLGPNEAIAREHYAQGEELFREKKYNEAADQFAKAASRWPDSALEEDAMYMLGESYFFADRYSRASDTFANLLKKYENSRYLERVVHRQFAIGRYWDQIGAQTTWWLPNFTDKTRPYFDTPGNAIAVYESVRLNDPTGPLADDATMATANAYFLSGRYEDAAYHYELLRTQFPQSEHQFLAHKLALQSNLRAYQGPQYDAAPLKKADELVHQLESQFRSQMTEEERELLERARQIVRAQQAEREWAMAEYYYKTDYNRAALHYYNIVVRDYPDTRFAEMARERMATIPGTPAAPPDGITWLIDKIPGTTKR